MVIYICEKCTKKFNKKSNYQEHLNKKRPCVLNSNNIPNIPIIANDLNINDKENNTCDYCGKNFSTTFKLNKQIKNS